MLSVFILKLLWLYRTLVLYAPILYKCIESHIFGLESTGPTGVQMTSTFLRRPADKVTHQQWPVHAVLQFVTDLHKQRPHYITNLGSCLKHDTWTCRITLRISFFSSDVVWIQNESQMTHHNIVFKLFKTVKHNVLVLVLWTKEVTDYYIIYCRNNNLYLCLRCPLVYNIFNNN